MSPRTLVLVVAAVAVFGLGVYLFVEVRAAPASPSAAIAERTVTGPHEGVTPAAPEGSATPAPKTPTMASTETSRIHLGAADVDPQTQTPVSDTRANPKLDSIMEEANKAYDRQDFDEAKAIAGKVLSKQPTNIRMLRVMVSSWCVDGDKDMAQKYFDQLPRFDRDQMKQRCERYGIAFKDPPQ